ncbi:MAG TPA: galactose-1-phosphate uridylyltransferase [Polyangiaceae bacterium]|jgi:UDPglucose--hexose-1-phosphate uridylyltransferase|nr:galactose-1-phosphate uridylyltransferase [Polyangiaceae bacterium]
MSVLRYDVTTGDWVTLASARASRPDQLGVTRGAPRVPLPAHDPKCPFCPGNEAETRPTVDQELDPLEPGRWTTRIFENKFPALEGEGPITRRQVHGLFREMEGHGRHEVLVESRDHGVSFAELAPEQRLRVLELLHRRAQALGADPALEVVQIFKNSGASAGASLAHSHFQLIATPVVPHQIRIKMLAAADHYQLTGRSVYVELCQAELDAGARVIATNDAFVAFAPFASRAAYEIWVMPRVPAPTFGQAQRSTLPDLAAILGDMLRRLARALDDPPYNLIINSAPRRNADEPDFVWHVEILPRVAVLGGFELGTRMAISTVEPERAAERLREAGSP